MNFPKHQYDSSSDDSDVIPPTPAAKSTPLVPVNRFRTQSTSSSASSKTPKMTGRCPAGDESSTEDEDAPQGTPMARGGGMKREAASNSSSEEDHNNTMKKRVMARLDSNQQKRPVHAMSDSEDSDNAPGADTRITQNHKNRQDDSSEESDDDNDNVQISKKVPVAVKQEKPSASETSEESEDEPNHGIVNAHAVRQSSDGSESDDETPGHRHLTQNIVSQTKAAMQVHANDTSSEESDDEVELKPVVTKSHQASDDSDSEEEAHLKSIIANSHNRTATDDVSSSEDDEATSKPMINNNPRKDSNEEESSGDDEVTSRPTLNNKSRVYSREEESSNEEVEQKPVIKKSHQASGNKSSGDENESEEEARLQSIIANNHNRKATDKVSSSEDDEPTPKQTSNFKPRDDSSEGESNEDGIVPSKLAQKKRQDSSFGHQAVYYDSSEDEASDKSQDEVEQKVNPIQIPKSNAEKIVGFSKSHSRQEPRVAVPDSGHKGLALLKETFAKSSKLQVDSASLSLEDIGSDDEIWLLQCPQSMDISALKKRSLNLSSENEIQLEDGPTFKRFSVTPQQTLNNSINCLLPQRSQNKFQISCLPVKGKIVINEHIHVPKLRLPEARGKGPVPFPAGLKVRHPLLGTGYKKYIAEARKTLEESALRDKQTRKKKKRSLENGYSDLYGSYDLSLQSNGKKKRSGDINEFITPNSKGSNSLYEEGSSSKKKKLSLNANDFEDGSLKKSDRKKHKTSKQQFLNESSVNDVEDGRASSKKDKSSSSQNSLSSFDNESSVGVSLKRKKKSKKEIEGNLSEGAVQHSWHIPQKEEMPVSAISKTDTYSKKKSKNKELLKPFEVKQENLDTSGNVSSEMPNNKAKAEKRKRKDVDQSNVALDSYQIPSKKKKYSV